MEPRALAEACAATMWAGDEANRTLATRLAEVAPGRAVMCLDLGPQHLNSHGICHGGFIFALADSAFAYAANSHNVPMVAQVNQITFVSPVRGGETLTATATELSRSGRSAIYDIMVTGGDGRLVATLRANGRSLPGQHIPDAQTQG